MKRKGFVLDELIVKNLQNAQKIACIQPVSGLWAGFSFILSTYPADKAKVCQLLISEEGI